MANRIKAASMTVYANDRQLDRLQAFGVSARLDTEDLKEIGNLDIIEVLDNVPTVDITCDSNQYGSVKTLASFAGKNRDWGTVVVTVKDANTITVNTGVYYINEMAYHVTTAVDADLATPTSGKHRWDIVSIKDSGDNLDSGTPTVTITAGDEQDIATALTTADINDTPAGELRVAIVYNKYADVATSETLTAKHVLNVNGDQTIALTDFEYAKVDFVCPVKETGDNTTNSATYPIKRSMYVTDAYVNRYDAAFSVNGLATENYSLESDNKIWFLNTAGAIFTDRFHVQGAAASPSASSSPSASPSTSPSGTADAMAQGSLFVTTFTPTQRPNGDYLLKVVRYDSSTGLYTTLVEDTDYTYTVGTKALRLATVLTANQTVLCRYPVDPTSLNYDWTYPFMHRAPDALDAHPAIAGGLRGGQVEIYLSDDSANHVLRLQSVSISAALSREALYEIGHKRAYDRPLTFPLPITIQVEALQSDLKEYARLQGATFTTAKELSVDQFLKNLDLTVKVYREDDVTRALSPTVQGIPLKEITVTNVSITDESSELRVDGNGTQQFSLKANTNLTVLGRI